jgi:hypothetical protein
MRAPPEAWSSTTGNRSACACSKSRAISGRELAQDEALGGDVDDGEVGDDPLHDALAGQRQRALVDDLVRAVLGDVLHHHDHALGAVDEVHRAAHALDHLAGDHPVGEVAAGETCIAPRIARSMWPPRIIPKTLASRRSAPRGIGHGLLAGVDEVGVLLALVGVGPDAEDAVLALQHDLDAVGT